jgi:hypothetical protein
MNLGFSAVTDDKFVIFIITISFVSSEIQRPLRAVVAMNQRTKED